MNTRHDSPFGGPRDLPAVSDSLPADIAAVADRLDRLASAHANDLSPEFLERIALAAAAQARASAATDSASDIAGRIAPRTAPFRAAPMRIAAVFALAAGASVLVWTLRPPTAITIADRVSDASLSNPGSPLPPDSTQAALAPDKAAAYDSLLAAVEWSDEGFGALAADLDTLARSVSDSAPIDDPTGMLDEGAL